MLAPVAHVPVEWVNVATEASGLESLFADQSSTVTSDGVLGTVPHVQLDAVQAVSGSV